jgi:hypothetical protein
VLCSAGAGAAATTAYACMCNLREGTAGGRRCNTGEIGMVAQHSQWRHTWLIASVPAVREVCARCCARQARARTGSWSHAATGTSCWPRLLLTRPLLRLVDMGNSYTSCTESLCCIAGMDTCRSALCGACLRCCSSLSQQTLTGHAVQVPYGRPCHSISPVASADCMRVLSAFEEPY